MMELNRKNLSKSMTASLAASLLVSGLAAAPVAAQNTSGSQNSSGMSNMSSMGGGDYYTRMSSAQKERYSWIFNNLDQREVNRFRAQGFSDTDIRGAAHIAMATNLSVPYVLSRYRVTGLSLPMIATELGVPRLNLTGDIPGYGMSDADMSMTMSGMSGMSSSSTGSGSR